MVMLPFVLVPVCCWLAAPALAVPTVGAVGSPQVRTDSYFTALRPLSYSLVEHVPSVDPVYPIHRASKAAGEGLWRQQWLSVAEMAGGSIRDVVLLADLADPIPSILVLNMAEPSTGEMLNIFHSPQG
ncbi:hypothetical protein JDV02_006097 [Purpureocillium takamizusanense]|uniref:Uncharacterized protein n=1 Tax=Purpureocillium takamizusanense TaxID=2060973 RepID=A0A9Q8VAZ7_9HYPO|nr:uncharacterized protein JDV02_006097 [Purpureocillium takamizusanense]UNI19955.1 hypothetical protein JDV02_006097 [Purpureocillium takamizusanense]